MTSGLTPQTWGDKPNRQTPAWLVANVKWLICGVWERTYNLAASRRHWLGQGDIGGQVVAKSGDVKKPA